MGEISYSQQTEGPKQPRETQVLGQQEPHEAQEGECKALPWGGVTPGTSAGWEQSGRVVAQLKRTWELQGCQAVYEFVLSWQTLQRHSRHRQGQPRRGDNSTLLRLQLEQSCNSGLHEYYESQSRVRASWKICSF